MDTNVSDVQLKQLVDNFNGFPRNMFKYALLKLYASCDGKLSVVRNDLFKIVCQMQGFLTKTLVQRGDCKHKVGTC